MATKWKDIKFKFSEEERLKIRKEALAEVRAMEEGDREPGDIAWLRQAWQESLDDHRPSVPMEEVMDRLEAKYKAIAAEHGTVE